MNNIKLIDLFQKKDILTVDMFGQSWSLYLFTAVSNLHPTRIYANLSHKDIIVQLHLINGLNVVSIIKALIFVESDDTIEFESYLPCDTSLIELQNEIKKYFLNQIDKLKNSMEYVCGKENDILNNGKDKL